jgi:hypothetical protein
MPTNVYELELVYTMVKGLNRNWEVSNKIPDLWPAFLRTIFALSGKVLPILLHFVMSRAHIFNRIPDVLIEVCRG